VFTAEKFKFAYILPQIEKFIAPHFVSFNFWGEKIEQKFFLQACQKNF